MGPQILLSVLQALDSIPPEGLCTLMPGTLCLVSLHGQVSFVTGISAQMSRPQISPDDAV